MLEGLDFRETRPSSLLGRPFSSTILSATAFTVKLTFIEVTIEDD